MLKPFLSLKSAGATGITCAVAAAFFFGVSETIAKGLTEGYHATQILLLRGVAGLALAGYLLRRAGGNIVLRTAQPLTQIARGVASVLCMYLAVLSYTSLPIGDALAIIYSAPIAVSLLAPVLLGVRVGYHHLVAVCIGFVGVVLILNPGDGVMQPAALLALGAMLCFAVGNLLTQRLARTDHSFTTIVITQLCVLVFCLPVQPWVWVTPHSTDLPPFALLICAATLAQFLLTEAYRHAPATTIAPIDYTTILWATVFGLILWQEQPDATSLAGIAAIVAAGLCSTFRLGQPYRRVCILAVAGGPFQKGGADFS